MQALRAREMPGAFRNHRAVHDRPRKARKERERTSCGEGNRAWHLPHMIIVGRRFAGDGDERHNRS
ncbi:MAG: hypothetical protein JWO20_1722 [Candidatus Angelobacter sp.]|nr:hypothetical protein [Candidatus Angelobacter sp.]